jgi:chromatin structure-remodeling complex protein RSC7
VDDYYENKVLADITEKGLKPGDLVGELADPNAPSAAALAAAELANAQKADRSGGTQGIYRAGGPTTLFGGPGWGPYSDGPLNAVRKSLLNRDGLNEENWMFVAAQRAAEANADWAKQRRRALVPYGGIFGAVSSAGGAPDEEEEEEGGGAGGAGASAGAEGKEGRGKSKGQEQEEHERAQEQRENDAGTRRRKRARREEKVPRGMYEPHSGIVLCEFFFFSPLLFPPSPSYFIWLHVLIYRLRCRSRGYAAKAGSVGGLEGFGGKATSARGNQGR